MRPQDDPTRFYVLTVPHSSSERFPASESKRLKVGLKPVELPAYLRSKSMVIRTGANEIHFAEFDRWAEPLDQGISRVTKEILTSAPNVQSVTLNPHEGDVLDCEVAIRILTCEGMRAKSGASTIRFAAVWEVRAVGTNPAATKWGGFTAAAAAAAWNGKDYGQLVERMSVAIADASIALAADLPKEANHSPGATPLAHP